MTDGRSHSIGFELPPRPEGAAAYRSNRVRPPGPASLAKTGFTLVEMVIVIAIIAAMVLVAVTRMDNWQDREAVRTAARTVEGAFNYARGEAIRKGNVHVVFFGSDIGGANLSDNEGNTVPILVLDDGRPGTAGQNCQIDAGEPTQVFHLERGVAFGTNAATAKVPVDEGTQPMAPGWSFSDGGGNPAHWVLFRPDGTPRSATNACVMGALGSGGGAIYLSNAERDAAIVLSPLGASRVYAWNGETSQWH
jgi:prepilin-type N-terminal cleavage/methylation domain-containing protein